MLPINEGINVLIPELENSISPRMHPFFENVSIFSQNHIQGEKTNNEYDFLHTTAIPLPSISIQELRQDALNTENKGNLDLSMPNINDSQTGGETLKNFLLPMSFVFTRESDSIVVVNINQSTLSRVNHHLQCLKI